MSITPGQVSAARQMLGWTRVHLAEVSGLSPSAVAQAETNTCKFLRLRLSKLQLVLEAAGVEFTFENSGETGMRLRMPVPPAASVECAKASVDD